MSLRSTSADSASVSVDGRERPRVLIIAIGDLARLSKIHKVAWTLTTAGYEVVRLGFKVSDDDMTESNDEYGLVVRLDTERALPDSDGGAADESTGVGESPLRRTLKKQLFRFRAGRILRKRVVDRRSARASMRFIGHQNARLYDAAVQMNPDLVMSSQFNALPAGYRAARGLRVPFVYDARDLVCAWTADSPALRRQYSQLEGHFIRRADLVVAVSPEMADHIASEYSVARPLVVYNGSLVRAGAATPPHQPVRLLYQGRFSPERRLSDLVEAVRLLGGLAHLTLQGWGVEEAALREKVRTLDLDEWVAFVGPVRPVDTPLFANDYDVGVIGYAGSTENLRVAAPNKLFDYLGAGIAVLASDLPGTRSVLESGRCGILFEPTGPQAIADAVRKIAEDPDALYQMKANALAVWDRYSWDKQGQKLLGEIDRLLDRERLLEETDDDGE